VHGAGPVRFLDRRAKGAGPGGGPTGTVQSHVGRIEGAVDTEGRAVSRQGRHRVAEADEKYQDTAQNRPHADGIVRTVDIVRNRGRRTRSRLEGRQPTQTRTHWRRDTGPLMSAKYVRARRLRSWPASYAAGRRRLSRGIHGNPLGVSVRETCRSLARHPP